MRRAEARFWVEFLKGLCDARRYFQDMPAGKTVHLAGLVFLVAIRTKLKFCGDGRRWLDGPDHRVAGWLRQLGGIKEPRAKRGWTRRLLRRLRLDFHLSHWLRSGLAMWLVVCAVIRFPGCNELAKLVPFAARQ